jgi:CheY-like chemotaxis protein
MSYLSSEINIKKLGLFLLLINSIHAISWFFYFRDGNEIFYLRIISAVLAIAFLMPIKSSSIINPYLLAALLILFFPFLSTLHVITNQFSIKYIFSEIISLLIFIYFFRKILLLLTIKLLGSFLALLVFLVFYDYSLLFDSNSSLITSYVAINIILFLGLALEHKFFFKSSSDINDIVIEDILRSAIFNAKSTLAVFRNYLEVFVQKNNNNDFLLAKKEVLCSVRNSKVFFNLLSKSISKNYLPKDKFENLPIQKIVSLAVKNLPLENDLKEKISIKEVDNFYFLGEKESAIYAILNLLYYLIRNSNKENNNKAIVKTKRGQWENILVIRYFDNKVDTFSTSNSFKNFAFSENKGVYELGLSFFQKVIYSIGGRIDSELYKGEYVKISIYFPKNNNDETIDYETQESSEKIKKTNKTNESQLKIISYQQGGVGNKLQNFVDKGILRASVDATSEVLDIFKMHSKSNYDLIAFNIYDIESEIIKSIRSIKSFDPGVKIIILTSFSVSALEEDFADMKLKVGGIFNISLQDHDLMEKMTMAIGNPKYINMGELVKNNFPKIKILVVDDQSVMRILAYKRLKNMGIEVVLADSGKSCLKQLDQEEGVNVIMLDLYMPNMNGVDTSVSIRTGNKFKKFTNGKNIPIILYTGDSKEDISDIMIEYNINDYLAKDFSDFDMLRILNKFFCK